MSNEKNIIPWGYRPYLISTIVDAETDVAYQGDGYRPYLISTIVDGTDT